MATSQQNAGKRRVKPRLQTKDACQRRHTTRKRSCIFARLSFLRRERYPLYLNSACLFECSCPQEIARAYLFSDESFTGVFTLDIL